VLLVLSSLVHGSTHETSAEAPSTSIAWRMRCQQKTLPKTRVVRNPLGLCPAVLCRTAVHDV